MADRTCVIPECDRKVLARDMCNKHYKRLAAGLDPYLPTARDLTESQRFWLKVDKTETCWLWTAALDFDGYGIFTASGRKTRRAHRWSYEDAIGAPVAAGLTLDHLCRVRNCVRPDHLEPVTSRENTYRSPVAPAVLNAQKELCIHGHELVGAPGFRRCPTCAAHHSRRYRGVPNPTEAPTLAAPGDRTHCPQGHAYDDENTYVSSAGTRHCRTCHRNRERAAYWNKKGKQ